MALVNEAKNSSKTKQMAIIWKGADKDKFKTTTTDKKIV